MLNLHDAVVAEDAVALHTRQVLRVAGAGAGERLAEDLAQETASTRTGVTGAGTPTHVVTLIYKGRTVGAARSLHRWGEEVRTCDNQVWILESICRGTWTRDLIRIQCVSSLRLGRTQGQAHRDTWAKDGPAEITHDIDWGQMTVETRSIDRLEIRGVLETLATDNVT